MSSQKNEKIKKEGFLIQVLYNPVKGSSENNCDVALVLFKPDPNSSFTRNWDLIELLILQNFDRSYLIFCH